MMTNVLPEVRARIERYLGRVEAHLEGLPPDERDEVLRDVESHVYDALAGRVPDDAAPTDSDVEALLLDLDPPSSWGPAPQGEPPAPPSRASPPARSLPPIEWVLLATTAAILFLCFLPIWGTAPPTFGAARHGVLIAGILLAAAAVVSSTRLVSRTADLPPLAQQATVSGAGFVLLVVSAGAILASLAAAATKPGYASFGGHPSQDAEARALRLSQDALRNLSTSVVTVAVTVAVLAFLFSWILGRFALAPAANGSRLEGWARFRAAISPTLGALSALALLPLLPAVAFSEVYDTVRMGRYDPEHLVASPILAGWTAAALATAVLFGLAGLLTRFAPAVVRALFAPLTDRLRPSQAKGYLLASLVFLALFAGLLVVTLTT